MILFQPEVGETTYLRNSKDVGCDSDYVCDELEEDDTDEDDTYAGDILSDNDVYKTEDECDEETTAHLVE